MVYNQFVNESILRIAYEYPFLNIDKGLLELFGPTGLFTVFSYISCTLRSCQIGHVAYYGLFLVLTFFYFFLFWMF